MSKVRIEEKLNSMLYLDANDSVAMRKAIWELHDCVEELSERLATVEEILGSVGEKLDPLSWAR